MEIINKTHWETPHLRAFVSPIAAQELTQDQRNRLRLWFTYTRRAGSSYASGCAVLNGSTATVRLSKHTPDKIDLAMVIAHELAHVRGMRHPSMKGDPRYDRRDRTGEIYSWALALPLEVREPRQKAKPGPDRKLEHAEAMLAINERKLKRFTTICKKWRVKVRYYERKTAAMNAAIRPAEGGMKI